ncbi:hypothetical protein Ga0074812_101116 [Parafrankia irregularis]|uniref:Uncharacterized protein n=1 Tax=Parafrankia irregularis TaxID=795642 RepID=A0A0S4QEG0_9ACTN|nr:MULTISPECIES: hypothetical protein [Parafrankia]MBE3199712.1 hypothetical protein [Parafrankia sp. CH37]CUU53618.1 hypothetical protein Ga0074812_101116 [Parafrankia irregularis]
MAGGANRAAAERAYDVSGGDLRADRLLGEAVLTAAGWQVPRRTFCGVLGAAGAQCPDQPG